MADLCNFQGYQLWKRSESCNFGVVKKIYLSRWASWLAISALTVLASCSGSAAQQHRADPREPQVAERARFCADSAYSYVARQVAFGPRVPGSDAHRACADWMARSLRESGADTVMEQQAALEGFGPMRNIFARFNPAVRKRVLLMAHYDTRPWADEDADPARRSAPIDGANDGGSGVGVLLELARQMGAQRPEVGVDLLLVDAEDSGHEGDELSWARGAQYFAAHPLWDPAYPPAYAVLLDMVGGRDAVFPREQFSQHYAPAVVERVWQQAARSGHGARFVNTMGGGVNDDHLHMLRIGIPAIDVIESAHPATGSFNPTWHTAADNLDNIDPATLRAVGETISNLIYNESL